MTPALHAAAWVASLLLSGGVAAQADGSAAVEVRRAQPFKFDMEFELTRSPPARARCVPSVWVLWPEFLHPDFAPRTLATIEALPFRRP